MVSIVEAVSDPIQALAELLRPALDAEGFALPSQDRSTAIRTAIQVSNTRSSSRRGADTLPGTHWVSQRAEIRWAYMLVEALWWGCAKVNTLLYRASTSCTDHTVVALAQGALNTLTGSVQGLFEYALSEKKPSPAPQRKGSLHVEGFDAEQIWAQLEPQAAALSSRARRLIKVVPPSTVLTTRETELDLDGESQARLLLAERTCVPQSVLKSGHHDVLE